MKFNISKKWIEKKAKLEEGCSVEAGTPPTEREMWLAEVRRLLVTKYAIASWSAGEMAEYAESLAETFFDDDPTDPEKPDDAIYEDFAAGL